MALKNEVDAIYLSLVETGNIRVVEYPAAWGGINLISDGVIAANTWMAADIQIVAAAVVANPCWLLGIELGVPVVEAFECDIRISIGGAGVEVDYAELSNGCNAFPVVGWNYPFLALPFPIRLAGTPRVAYNIRKSTAASLAGFNASHLVCATGVAT